MDSATSTDFCKSSLSLGSWFWLSGFEGTCQYHDTHTAVTYGGFNCCGSDPPECTVVWTRLLGAERAPNLLVLATGLMSPSILGGLSQEHWHRTEKIYWKEALEENDKYSHSQNCSRQNVHFHVTPAYPHHGNLIDNIFGSFKIMLTYHVLPIYKYDCESLSCQDQGRDVDRCI